MELRFWGSNRRCSHSDWSGHWGSTSRKRIELREYLLPFVSIYTPTIRSRDLCADDIPRDLTTTL